MFGVDISSSTKIDNRTSDILILGKGPTQGIWHKFSAEKLCSINFTNHFTKFCVSLHYNGVNSHLLMVQRLSNLQQKMLKSIRTNCPKETYQKTGQ